MSSPGFGSFFDMLTSKKGAALAVPAILLFGATLAIGQKSFDAMAQDKAAPPAASAAAPATPGAPAAPAGTSSAGVDRKEVEKIIREYLIANPEVMIEVQTALEAKMEKIKAEKMKTMLGQVAGRLYRSPTAAVAGNPSGDVTIVEFFDYNCGYCKVSLAAVAKVIEGDPKVRVVFKEVTFIGRETSAGASRIALAARKQGKYWEVHRALLENKGVVNEALALKVAEKFGLNMDQLKRDAASAEIKKELDDATALAESLGIDGTPFFLVGDRVISGAGESLANSLQSLVADVRKTGCKVC
ncbi:MAG TPA: DsbA family protein [Hyphomicrobiaceae bacterium]|nr:DsbA family protein [Hyphomicrobiaceae bacterium]